MFTLELILEIATKLLSYLGKKDSLLPVFENTLNGTETINLLSNGVNYLVPSTKLFGGLNGDTVNTLIQEGIVDTVFYSELSDKTDTLKKIARDNTESQGKLISLIELNYISDTIPNVVITSENEGLQWFNTAIGKLYSALLGASDDTFTNWHNIDVILDQCYFLYDESIYLWSGTALNKLADYGRAKSGGSATTMAQVDTTLGSLLSDINNEVTNRQEADTALQNEIDNLSLLVTKKTYADLVALNADTANPPQTDEAIPQDLLFGQLVIVRSDSAHSNLAAIYRYKGYVSGANVWEFVHTIGDLNTTVLYTSQTKTNAEKAQARTNIDAAQSGGASGNLKESEIISRGFTFKNFGFTPGIAENTYIQAIKSIKLVGDWDSGKNYQIRYLSRNHTTAKWRIIIQEVDSLGTVIVDVYDSLPTAVTEAGVNKITKVRFNIIKNKQVILEIDYNVITDNSIVQLVNSNYTLSYIVEKSFPIVYIPYTNSPQTIETVQNQAFKNIILSGDWDVTKNYQIRAIYRNDATYKYRIIIQEVDSLGVHIADLYDSGIFNLIESSSGITKVTFPKISNRQIIAEIDYSYLTASSYVVALGLNYNINPTCIKAIDNNGLVDTLKQSCFYDTGLKTAGDNAKLIASAIKSIALIGNWDKTKKYVIRAIGRNEATSKYRLIIEILNDDGTYVSPYAFDSVNTVVTEAGAGKPTTVLFSYTSYSDKQVLAVIDYNLLTTGTLYNINGGNPYAVKPEFIYFSDKLNQSFLYKNFGKAINSDQYTIVNCVKNIQLIGDWNNDEYYIIRYLTRSFGGTPIWRIILSSVDKSGNIITLNLYDKTLTNVVENSIGTTYMDFGWIGKKRVIAEIDYNQMSANLSIDIQNNPPNYIINPACIKATATSIDYKQQDTLSVAGIDFIAEQTPVGHFAPQFDKGNISLSKIPKKGFLSFRTDDNHILKEVVAIVEKFGYRYNLAVNMAILDYLGQDDYFRGLQAKGHELCDHTPNHNTLQATIRNEWLPIFNAYIGNGIDRIVDLVAGVSSTVIFTKEYRVNYLDVQFGATNGFQTVAGSNTITGDFSSLRQITSFPTFMAYIYIPVTNGAVSAGWHIIKSSTTGQITISDELGNAINFANSENITCYIIQSQGYENNGSIKVTLTENATYLLLLAGQMWFQFYNLVRPQTWVQPGGDHPWLLNSRLEKAFDKLGMSWAETVDEYRYLTYNFADKYINKRTGVWWDDAPLHFDYVDQTTLQAAKEKIADHIALKRIRSIASHYRWSSFVGATDAEKKLAYINHVHSVFEFMYKNGIQLLTFTERKKMLLDAIVDESANIMPPLSVDMSGRGRPDGYIITDGNIWSNTNGLPESKNYSIKINPLGGRIFDVPNLGAVEKGDNEFSVYAKGTFNCILTIIDENGNYLCNENISNTTLEYAKITKTFRVPLTVNYIRVVLDYSSANDGNCFITNIRINK